MKPIPKLHGYFATEEGAIISMRSGQPRAIRQRLNDGYQVVTLSVCGHGKAKRRHRFDVHRLVLLAYAGEPASPGMQARHLNGVRADNRPSNLSWGTPQQNAADAIAHGTLGPGMRARHRRLSEHEVQRIVERRLAGEAVAVLASEFNVSKGYIPKLVSGARWACIGRP